MSYDIDTADPQGKLVPSWWHDMLDDSNILLDIILIDHLAGDEAYHKNVSKFQIKRLFHRYQLGDISHQNWSRKEEDNNNDDDIEKSEYCWDIQAVTVSHDPDHSICWTLDSRHPTKREFISHCKSIS